MSNSWSLYIILLTVANVIGCFWLIRWTTKKRTGEATQGDVTGHTWDGNLQEYNNPLPRWWLWLFYLTMIFAAIYLALYPGLGNLAGKWGWTQEGQYNAEIAHANEKYGPIFAAYAKQPIVELAKNDEAMASGQRLFLNYCATCHGSDAGGATGFPNLTDNDWLYGGEPEQIKQTILDGRNGIMPPMGAGSPPEKLDAITSYVLSLSGREADNAKVEEGKVLYTQLTCIACHGPDGKGNSSAGFPNLTDDIWLYGGSPGAIKQTLTKGRSGKMPAHRAFLGEEKVHLLAAYVYSLSHK
ncbi:MAG: cytochrome-c oxidase, cbb3-type subunit III [Thioalkalispiraceae bacterium]|jgi:cytochrome c oxidase cbb3-type subunit 3